MAPLPKDTGKGFRTQKPAVLGGREEFAVRGGEFTVKLLGKKQKVYLQNIFFKNKAIEKIQQGTKMTIVPLFTLFFQKFFQIYMKKNCLR